MYITTQILHTYYILYTYYIYIYNRERERDSLKLIFTSSSNYCNLPDNTLFNPIYPECLAHRGDHQPASDRAGPAPPGGKRQP